MNTLNDTFNIAVIGELEIVQVFRSIGCHIYDAKSGNDVRDLILNFKNMNAKTKYGIVLVLENLLEDIGDEDYKKITSDPLPVITAIPAPNKKSEYSLKKLKKLTEQALGSDILN